MLPTRGSSSLGAANLHWTAPPTIAHLVSVGDPGSQSLRAARDERQPKPARQVIAAWRVSLRVEVLGFTWCAPKVGARGDLRKYLMINQAQRSKDVGATWGHGMPKKKVGSQASHGDLRRPKGGE